MANWWERQMYAAKSYASRLLEQGGVFDITDELARFDDDDMSATDYLSAAGSALWQTAHMPLQQLMSGAQEVNRIGGTLERMTPTEEGVFGQWNFGAVGDYFTGGLDESERQKIEAERGIPAARAGYTPVSLSDAYIIGVDKAVNRYGKGIMWTPQGIPYAVGSFFNPTDGVQSNGSYLPASFDMYSQDAGQQVWERSQMTHQLIAGQVVVESVVDPMNFLSGPLAASIKGMRAATLTGTRGMVAAEDVAKTFDLIANGASEQRQMLRFRQWVPGRGLWTPQRMLTEMAYNPNQRKMLERIAETKDVGTLRRWISEAPGGAMAEGEGADVLASILSRLDKPEDVAAAFYAAAYRDETAINRVLGALEDGVGSMPAANELKTMTGVGLNVLEEAPFQFGDGLLPDGHLLRSYAPDFVNHAIDNAVAKMGLPEGTPNPLREQWDALAKAQQDAVYREVQSHRSAMLGAERMLKSDEMVAEGRMLTSLPTGTRGTRILNRVERGDPRASVRAGNWLTSHFIPAIKVNGRSTRTSASVWLTSRPGLTFSLHGLDAVERFDDVIHYVDGLTEGGFANLDLVKQLRDEFVQAGAVTKAPEQMRASLMNQLQTEAITTIAARRGASPEAARLLAEAGMSKGEKMARALNSMDEGYTTTIVEDGVPLILAGHPAAARQTANFIPLMDLKAVDDALKSKGLQAYTMNGDMLLSEVKAELDLVGATEKGVARVGRNKMVRGAHTVTDLMDGVNTVFKASVLLRLGYPVRNLSEAHLSAYASGTGWLNVMAAADIPTLMSNFMVNVANTPFRMIDRTKTYWGLVKNEDALLAAAKAIEPAVNQSADNIKRLVMAATDEATLSALVRAVNEGSPVESAAAVRDLKTLLGWRMRAVHELDVKHAGDGLLGEHAKLSGRYYHADTTGDFALDGANGPISVVSDPVVAQDNIDALWSADDWRNAAPPRGAGSIPKSAFTPAQRRVLAEVAAASPSKKWAVRPDGTIQFKSGNGYNDIAASLDAEIAATTDAARKRVLVNARKNLDESGKWVSHQKALASRAKGEHVQFRADEDSPWVDWDGKTMSYRGGARASYQFRTVPKGKAGGQPSKTGIDAWGPELDLTDDAVVDSMLAKFGDRMDAKTLGEARAGDRAAQVRLSEVMAKEGYYRLRLPEGAQWNGEHILVHPDGVGERAYARLLKEQIEDLVRADINPNVNVPLLQSKKAVRKANQGMITDKGAQKMGAALVPEKIESRMSNAKILEEGGFGALLEEAIDTHRGLKSQQAAINAAYLTRSAKTHRLAKRRGIGEKTWTFGSQYATYKVADLLHGRDGGAYSQVTSGDLTQTMVYSTSAHQAELLNDMSRAMMNPEEITPGDPRYFDALANLMGRHLRDTPGAVPPGASQAITSDIDPVIARALQSGDRERLLDETIDWALNTKDGRNWLDTMGLKSAPTVQKAKAAAARAEARRGLPKPKGEFWTLEERRQIHRQQWTDDLNNPAALHDVEVADVIRAQFNFAENFILPNQRVRDLFLSGQATGDNLRAAYAESPWHLQSFNGLTSPTHPSFRRSMKQRRMNEDSMGRVMDQLIPALGTALQKIGSGPETRLARHPVYLAIGKSDLQQRIAYGEATLGRALNMDELLMARSASQKFALRKMEETLYTLKSRSAVDDFMRFVMPFFPAWRNTVSRWGKFAATNPGGVAQVGRLYNSAFGDMPFYDSATGDQIDLEAVDPKEAFTLLPGVGSWVPGWKNDPAMKEAMRRTKISPRSIDVIFQGDAFNPGFGPWMAVPVQEILRRKSELYNSPVGKEVAKWFLPVGPQNTGSAGLDAVFTFLPSALKPLANKAFNTESYISTRNRVASTYVANGYGEGKTPQEIDEEIDNATVKMLGIKTLMYLVSPVSAQQVGDHEYYAGQYRSLMETQGDSRMAEEKFLERFGEERWLYTRSSTANLTGGMATGMVAENQRSLSEVNELATTVYDDPRLLGFLENLGPDGELMPYNPDDYNPYARNQQMQTAPGSSQTPYRGTKNFAELQKDAKAQLGWRYYDYGMDQLDLKLQEEGFVPGTPQFIKERGIRSPQVASVVGQKVPEWAEARGKIDSGKTERNADFFREVFTNTEWGKSRQGTAVAQSIMGYLADRERVRAEIARRYTSGQKGAAKSLNSVANEDLAAWLTARRELYSQGSLSFDDWAKQYFRNDNVVYDEEEIEAVL